MDSVLANLSPKTVEFVLARQKEDGGFGATPHLPSTVEDTYFGLSLLEMLEPSFARAQELKDRINRSIRYLKGLSPQPNWNPKTFYYYLLGRNIVGLGTEAGLMNYLQVSKRDEEWALEDLYYFCKSMDQLGMASLDLEKLGARSMDFGTWRTAKELWLKLSVADLVGSSHRPDRESAAAWVSACQNPDGGFGFYPGTTSFIENTHICLALLAMLDTPPQAPVAARDFILRCKTGRGGFARKNGGAPFLDATWHAIAGLKLLLPLLQGP